MDSFEFSAEREGRKVEIVVNFEEDHGLDGINAVKYLAKPESLLSVIDALYGQGDQSAVEAVDNALDNTGNDQ